ncbi:MAG: hypothetical protein SF097_03375 [Acidobacteriota bacterium]|nr:hypothetical protein [Acidobacteriota bacterium]
MPFNANTSAINIQKLLWAEVYTAPDSPGIYAWYYNPEITLFDLEEAIKRLEELIQSANQNEARCYVRELLDSRLFQYFRELPYLARIAGPLKPTHEGYLEHKHDISESLVSRVVENPQRLRLIREVLEVSAPHFASPLYIGMSDNLRERLSKHKSLIEKYRSKSPTNTGDMGFAAQVVQRRIPPERLFVVICELADLDGDPVDIENILNRIYYPILGRN